MKIEKPFETPGKEAKAHPNMDILDKLSKEKKQGNEYRKQTPSGRTDDIEEKPNDYINENFMDGNGEYRDEQDNGNSNHEEHHHIEENSLQEEQDNEENLN